MLQAVPSRLIPHYSMDSNCYSGLNLFNLPSLHKHHPSVPEHLER